jgi:hypothetical protein
MSTIAGIPSVFFEEGNLKPHSVNSRYPLAVVPQLNLLGFFRSFSGKVQLP